MELLKRWGGGRIQNSFQQRLGLVACSYNKIYKAHLTVHITRIFIPDSRRTMSCYELCNELTGTKRTCTIHAKTLCV